MSHKEKALFLTSGAPYKVPGKLFLGSTDWDSSHKLVKHGTQPPFFFFLVTHKACRLADATLRH